MLWHIIISFFSGLFLFTLQKKNQEESKQPLDYSVCSNMAAFFFKEICEQEQRMFVIQRRAFEQNCQILITILKPFFTTLWDLRFKVQTTTPIS